jgi:hypothetical protein
MSDCNAIVRYWHSPKLGHSYTIAAAAIRREQPQIKGVLRYVVASFYLASSGR